MAMFKCKMCGGELNVQEGMTVCECEYCGTKQTLPKIDDEQRANLYDRANHFRRNNEYDKAMGIYERILNEDKTDAEAYWSLVLCKYGIEYVEDPAMHKRIPTVNRAQYTSIFADEDYKQAIANADTYQKDIYESEAKAIDEIQKGILEISNKEDPFDVFICYKETDNDGKRTPDSVLATELYHELTREGFKVFFSRITLEDKLGTAYEPYIFAALNSSKVMVVLGTKPEYFNAVWVKNEWSRYLSLIKDGKRKALIPAYKDMDPYDLPEEFSHLQAQDMSKLGFMSDLIHGIKKITDFAEPKSTVKETVVMQGNSDTTPLLKRVFIFLEDGEWDNANEYCEKVLDINPECAEAYLGKLMVDLKVRKQDDLGKLTETFESNANYKKAKLFANKELSDKLDRYFADIEYSKKEEKYNYVIKKLELATTIDDFERVIADFKSFGNFKDSIKNIEEIECTKYEKAFDNVVKRMKSATTISDYDSIIYQLKKFDGYMNSAELIKECEENKRNIKIEKEYQKAVTFYNSNLTCQVHDAIEIFKNLKDYKDSNKLLVACQQKYENFKERDDLENKYAKKKDKKMALLFWSLLILFFVSVYMPIIFKDYIVDDYLIPIYLVLGVIWLIAFLAFRKYIKSNKNK